MRVHNKSDGVKKKCPRCGLTKVLDAYYKNNGKPTSYCKMCNIERTSKTTEHVKKYKKNYYQINRDKLIEYSKDFYYKNHRSCLERRRLYKLREPIYENI